ncbi:Uncharacterised protein [Mycobacteroides abscessus subsp. abscessus]|nr:Uncharacterised protein [Mycobacteroides abscessus subsp. abscessus]
MIRALANDDNEKVSHASMVHCPLAGVKPQK